MESFLPTQPESYKRLIWRSLVLYRASFSQVIFFSVLLSLIVFIPRLMADAIGQDVFATVEPISFYRLWIVIINIAALIFFIAILWHMFCVARGKHEPFIEDFVIGSKKAIYVFIAAVFQAAIVFAFGAIIYGFLILLHHFQLLFINSLLGIILTTIIFLGQAFLLIYVSTLFIFIAPLIAIENKGIFYAIETSVLLVWNHWWRVFSTQLTPWIFYTFLLIIFKYILDIDIHIFFTKVTQVHIWATILNIIAFALYMPWVAALLLVQLKDLELRKKIVEQNKRKTAKHLDRI